ncbi:MAG: hypothetical protein HDT29_00680 [Clostridiales bacterium]|nr:hypothetical protein [Clostridiales bacterium]
MASAIKVTAEVTSKKGFYVGDICYQMTDENYYADWSNDFNDFEGEHEIHGYKFGVGGTKYGDGCYEDQYGHTYGVDAGNIGILPYEICESKNVEEIAKYGRFIEATKATFTAEDGIIEIEFDNGEYIYINTGDYDEEDEEYYDEEYDDEYDDDED